MKLHQFKFRGKSFFFYPESLLLQTALTEDSLSQKSEMPGSGDPSCGDPASALLASNRIEILVNATLECNLTCPYCFVHQGQFSYEHERPPKLSPDLARQLIHALPAAIPGADEYCIHFYGGEPLLNPEAIGAAVEEAHAEGEKRFSFAITTNGTIDPGSSIPLLAKGNFSVILSIDGPAHIHDAARRDTDGKATHAKVLEFLYRIKKEHGLFVRGSSVIRHGSSLKDAEQYLEALPVDAIKAQAVRLPDCHPLALTKEEREQYFLDLEDIAAAVIEGLKDMKLPGDDRFTSRVLQLVCRSRRESFCGAGSSVFGMSCDGTIYPCVLHAGNERLALGHISDPEHGWFLKGKEWIRTRRQRDECKSCWAQPLCGGGCPAMLAVCGEDECEYTRKVCELALAIYGSVSHKPDLLILAGID